MKTKLRRLIITMLRYLLAKAGGNLGIKCYSSKCINNDQGCGCWATDPTMIDEGICEDYSDEL